MTLNVIKFLTIDLYPLTYIIINYVLVIRRYKKLKCTKGITLNEYGIYINKNEWPRNV